jgi:predicted peroxiredoxin
VIESSLGESEMRNWKLVLIAPLASLVLLVSCQGTEEVEEKVTLVPEQEGVFVHISHGTAEPHRVLMGLRMANVMSSDKDVLVYFDVKGVEVVLKDAEEIVREPFESAQTQLKTLLQQGVEVYVCPSCLEAAGATPEQVIEGVQIANKDAFFGFTDGRILTIDY